MKFLGRLFLCTMIAFALVRAALAGTERVDLQPRVEVDVLSKDAAGHWHARKGTFHGFVDARYLTCMEYKDNVVATCIVITDDGEVLQLQVRLLEDKV